MCKNIFATQCFALSLVTCDSKEKGFLYPFEASIGRAMFVSHQWLSPENPDPTFEQLEVLQQTMTDLLRGGNKISTQFHFLHIICFGSSPMWHVWGSWVHGIFFGKKGAISNRLKSTGQRVGLLATMQFLVLCKCECAAHLCGSCGAVPLRCLE